MIPSVPTPTFREPWGLVVNEAMNRGLAVIASDAVGAAAGGLVRDGENGLIVRAGRSARAGRGDLAARGVTRSCARASAPRAPATWEGYDHDAWAARLLAGPGNRRASPALVGSVPTVSV